MTLVETLPGETDAEFQTAIDAMLQAINPERPNWWHPYQVRGTYEYNCIFFRHFFCIAGSLELWVWLCASKGGPRRVIVVPDSSMMVFGGVKMVGGGKEIPVDADQIDAVPPAG